MSILAGEWGPGPGCPLAWWRWQGTAVTGGTSSRFQVSTLASSSPLRDPLDFIKSHWDMVLANISCLREGNRHSLARKSYALGRASPGTTMLRGIRCSL